MTYQPVVPISGLTGWRFLQRTLETQSDAFAKSASIVRDTDYFREKIGEVGTAEDLVSDRRLLRVALGAFGLQDDINNRYLIQKVLEDGTLKDDTLANRLGDDRYRAMSAAFGFGDFPIPSTKISDFGDRMVAKFRRQQFEVAIGDQDNSMRLALNAQRELEVLAAGTSSEDTKWLRIMGTPPLREVFEIGLAMPASFGQIDIDRQLELFKDRMEKLTGDNSIAQFLDPDARDQLVQRYLLQNEVRQFQSASVGSVALSLLQGASNFSRSLSNR